MYIYIIIKLFVEFFALSYKINIKNIFILIESIIIIGYFYLLYNNYFYINKYLFIWCLGWVIFFISYKSMNYMFINRKELLIKIKEKIGEARSKKIKEFFLRPIVCDLVYYGIWMLPWNIGYWIYFYVMEHGWYIRVWVTSARDIALLKIFKWDSRMFFYKINEKIDKNKIMLIIWIVKEEVIKGFLRILIFLSYLRKNFIKIRVIEYIINRILVFCYLSIFYLYVIEGVQIINKWILIVLIIIEIIISIFIGKILNYIIKKELKTNKDKYIKYIIKIFDIDTIGLIIDPLNNEHYEPAKILFEQNNMVWNKILENSVSLNILYEYMLYANKNKKGYYYYKYNILTKIKSVKLYEISNIPWSLIPKTRYIIMSMRYIQENCNQSIFSDDKTIDKTYRKFTQEDLNNRILSVPNFKIKNCKNLYLSLFEKSYINTSLLYLNFLLKLNYDINYIMLDNGYYKNIIKNIENKKEMFFLNCVLHRINIYKSAIWKLCLIEINRDNPKILEIAYILHLFCYEFRYLDILGYYLINLKSTNLEDIILKLDKNKKYSLSMKQYKKNIEILTHFVFFEEEGIIWNEELMTFFKELELNKNNSYKEFFSKMVSDNYKYGYGSKQFSWESQQNLKEMLIDDYGVKFNFDINKLSDEDFTFKKSFFFKYLGWKVEDWNNNTAQKDLLEELKLIFEDLEKINIEKIAELRVGLNKEILNKKYEEFKKKNNENE
jgi:hypothetical protein